MGLRFRVSHNGSCSNCLSTVSITIACGRYVRLRKCSIATGEYSIRYGNDRNGSLGPLLKRVYPVPHRVSSITTPHYGFGPSPRALRSTSYRGPVVANCGGLHKALRSIKRLQRPTLFSLVAGFPDSDGMDEHGGFCHSGNGTWASRQAPRCDDIASAWPYSRRRPSVRLQGRVTGQRIMAEPELLAIRQTRRLNSLSLKIKKPAGFLQRASLNNPAASYFPTASRQQYHRPWRT